MTRVTRLRPILVVLAAAALSIASCTQQPGNAVPQTSAPTTGATTSETSPSASAMPLANFDTCVFTAAERQKYGLRKVAPVPSLPDTSCSWRAGEALVTIGIINKPVDQIVDPDEPPEPIKINGSEAVQWTTGNGAGCWISFGYGPQTLHLQVTNNSGTNDCAIVEQFAKIVEPKLPPRGN